MIKGMSTEKPYFIIDKKRIHLQTNKLITDITLILAKTIPE
jgi:hypothetical protein